MIDPVKIFISSSEYQDELAWAKESSIGLDGGLNHICHVETGAGLSDSTPFLLSVIDEDTLKVEGTYYIPPSKP